MPELSWPSSGVPRTCPFRLTHPADWTVVEPPGALLALLAPELDGFRSNVIVSGGRLSESADLGAVVTAAFVHCEPASVLGPVLPEPLTEHHIGVAVRRGVTAVGGRRLAQLGVVVAADDLSPAGPRGVFGLLGTWPVDRTDLDEAVITEVISSFRPLPRSSSVKPSQR